jgi:hypothetical protein
MRPRVSRQPCKSWRSEAGRVIGSGTYSRAVAKLLMAAKQFCANIHQKRNSIPCDIGSFSVTRTAIGNATRNQTTFSFSMRILSARSAVEWRWRQASRLPFTIPTASIPEPNGWPLLPMPCSKAGCCYVWLRHPMFRVSIAGANSRCFGNGRTFMPRSAPRSRKSFCRSIGSRLPTPFQSRYRASSIPSTGCQRSTQPMASVTS